jgi:tetratricopeptide (TPR) repeat protein
VEAARRYLEQAIRINTEAGMSFYQSVPYTFLGMMHFFSGDLVSAQRSAEEGVRLAQQSGESSYEGLSWLVLGGALGTADPSQKARAEECLLRGIAIEEEIEARAFSCMGRLLLGRHHASGGQREKALEHLNKARTMAEEMGMDFWLAMAQDAIGKLEQ